jgi:Protein of unknown function (DUF2846)
MNKVIGFLTLALLTACATTSQSVKFADSSDKQAPTQAKIYVLRPSIFASAVRMKVFCNDKLIGATGPKSYLCWTVNPGEYVVRGNSENKDYFTVYAQAGKSYYIKQSPKMGWIIARVSLDPMDEKKAKVLLEKLKKPVLKYTE